jgi:hypothetical protein
MASVFHTIALPTLHPLAIPQEVHLDLSLTRLQVNVDWPLVSLSLQEETILA